MILPSDLGAERAAWIAAAGDSAPLCVGPTWDARTDPPRIVVAVSRRDGQPLSSNEIARVRERITAPLPTN